MILFHVIIWFFYLFSEKSENKTANIFFAFLPPFCVCVLAENNYFPNHNSMNAPLFLDIFNKAVYRTKLVRYGWALGMGNDGGWITFRHDFAQRD